tara:strand:- start:10961 stop:13213 length:2253 start_codon:yes stop_codon:yes gene_type:complete
MIQKSKQLILVLLFLLPISAFAQSATAGEKFAVQIKVTNFTSNSVSFSWTSDAVVSTSIYRKKISDTYWSRLKRNYSPVTYTDNTITEGTEYEYKFQVNTGSNPSVAYGYISFGAKIPQVTNRGNILLLVDDRFETSLASEIATLKRDLISEGWNPSATYCSKDTTVSHVKSVIDGIHATSALDGIYIIGHIPIPYSGLIYPDGHTDHKGAWPTDLYYVSDASDWTDNSVNYTNSSRPVNSNSVGDGKFDNSEMRGETFCPISRIDFYDLPKVASNETATLKNYLDKASSYKHGGFTSLDKGLVDDNLSAFSEGFSFNGHMNFSSLFGDSVSKSSLLSTLQSDTYKWSYACGYGSDSSLSGTGSVTTLKNSDYQGVFSMVFGSYFGDWNTEDNFMRSLLADGKMLTTCWAGRPNWFFHHMGLNNPIGTSSKMSVENSSNSWYLNTTPYDIYGYYSNGVHMQLLGDMSLRQNYKKAIGTFNTAYNTNTSSVDLTWAPPVGELVTEYKIYKSSDSLDNYTLLTTLLSTDSTFSDSLIASTGNYYYISYVTLDTTNSGSYYNRSTGTYGSSDTTGFAAMSALPMELISFDVVNENGTAKLQWSTSSEINSSHFELEKSIDGLTWSVFDEVQAAGHSSAIINYGGFDYNLSTMKTYYRLRLVDFDGTWEYSDVRVIDQKINTLSIYPNPSNLNKINLKGWLEPIDIDQLRITDTRGVDVPFTLSTADPGQIGLEQKPGVYYLNYNNEHIKFILL